MDLFYFTFLCDFIRNNSYNLLVNEILCFFVFLNFLCCVNNTCWCNTYEMQNNLHELWSLLNFLLPEIFSSAETFDEWFQISGENDQQEVVQQLHKVGFDIN